MCVCACVCVCVKESDFIKDSEFEPIILEKNNFVQNTGKYIRYDNQIINDGSH